MADDTFDSVPAALLRLLGLWFRSFELLRVDLLHKSFLIVKFALFTPLSYRLAEVGRIDRLNLHFFILMMGLIGNSGFFIGGIWAAWTLLLLDFGLLGLRRVKW